MVWNCCVCGFSRKQIKGDRGSVLAFDEMDKKCADHFLARRAATSGREAALKALEIVEDSIEAAFLSVRAAGWKALADAQTALAHSCLVEIGRAAGRERVCRYG